MPYSPLPPINQGTYVQPDNPMAKFTVGLHDLLQRAQGMDSATLLNERNRLATKQTTQSMAPAADIGTQGLAPGDALAARKNEAQLYNPEINNLTDRVTASANAVSRFASTLNAAKDFGETYMKYITPSDETVQAVRIQMRAGVKPSETVLEKVGKYLTEDDWNALVDAGKTKSTPTSVQEYEYAKTQGYTGTYDQWLTKDANRGDNPKKPTTITDKLAEIGIRRTQKADGGFDFTDVNTGQTITALEAANRLGVSRVEVLVGSEYPEDIAIQQSAKVYKPTEDKSNPFE